MNTKARVAMLMFLGLAVVNAYGQASPGQTSAPASVVTEVPASGSSVSAAASNASVGATSAATPSTSKKVYGNNRLLSEIIVTAEKRSENILSVPVAIQAFNPTQLDASGISSQADLAKLVPTLNIGYQAGFATVFIRGIGSEAFLGADPSVATYIDGVYYSFSPSIIQSFLGVKRVEVLKGPQGTLFGRNAVGGAINVITDDPTFDKPSGQINLSYGNYNALNAQVLGNVPITDDLALNVAAYRHTGDSFLSGSRNDGHDLNKEDGDGIRAKLRWAPTDYLDGTIGYIHTEENTNGTYPYDPKPTPLGTAVGVTPAHGYDGTRTGLNLYSYTNLNVEFGTFKIKTPFFDVKILGNHQRIREPYNYLFDPTTRPPIVSFDVRDQPARITEGELDLLSNAGTPFSDWLTLTGGLFFYQAQQGYDPVNITVATPDGTNPLGLFNGFPPNIGDFIQGGLNQAIPTGPLYSVSGVFQLYTNSLSEFLQAKIKFTDWASLILGGRYQHENRGVRKSAVRLRFYDPLSATGNTVLPLINFTQARDQFGNTIPPTLTDKNFEPKIGLDLHPFDDDTLVYLDFQKAEKAHTYNTFAVYLPPEYVAPEKTTSYQIGIKTTLFGGITHVDAAAFLYHIDNLQTQFISLLEGGAVSFENAPAARSAGFDFTISSELFPNWIDGLAGTLAGGFLSTKYVNYGQASGYDRTTGLFTHNIDATGNDITRSPRFSGSVVLNKDWDFGPHEVEFGGIFYYNSGFYYTAANNPDYKQKAYETLGLHLGYEYKPYGVRITAYGQNITDTFYTQGLIPTDFGPNFTLAPPVLYGVKLAWKF